MTEDHRLDRTSNASDDAVDRLIEDTLVAVARPQPVDLRRAVLRRLAEAPRRERPFAWMLQPAWLATAGASVVMIVGGVWIARHTMLSRSGHEFDRPPVVADSSTQPVATATGRRGGHAPDPSGQVGPSAARGSVPRSEPIRRMADARDGIPIRGLQEPAVGTGIAAMALVGDNEASLAADETAIVLPGAPAGDLGDPIAPLPAPRPIVIRPIVAPPLVAAPPISELVVPTTVPTVGDLTRDATGPGKSGGMHP